MSNGSFLKGPQHATSLLSKVRGVQLEGSHALQYDAVTRQPNGCMAVESCAAKIILEATQCLKKTLAGDDMT